MNDNHKILTIFFSSFQYIQNHRIEFHTLTIFLFNSCCVVRHLVQNQPVRIHISIDMNWMHGKIFFDLFAKIKS